MAANLTLPAARGLSAERRKKLAARLKEVGGIDGWREVLGNIAQMPFCYGESESGWKVSLDWLLSPKNLTKILEKTYAAKSGGG